MKIKYLEKLIKTDQKASHYHDFNTVMEIAHEIAKENPKALIDLIMFLGRSYQYYLMNLCFKRFQYEEIIELSEQYAFFDCFLPITDDMKNLHEIKIEKNIKNKPLSLKKDLIFPLPWNRERFISNLLTIGAGEMAGLWQQDTNHRIEYWLPIGIGWVRGGNHSLFAGIIKGEGVIEDYKCYDISKVYEYVKCDGRFFYKKNGSKLNHVNIVEFACIFEIGRLMIENCISF